MAVKYSSKIFATSFGWQMILSFSHEIMPLFDLRLLFTNGSIVGQNVDFWDHLRSAVRNIYAVTTASMSHICYAICDSVQNFKDFWFWFFEFLIMFLWYCSLRKSAFKRGELLWRIVFVFNGQCKSMNVARYSQKVPVHTLTLLLTESIISDNTYRS